MAADDQPLALAQHLHQLPALAGGQRGVAVHRGHQVGRQPVERRLLGREFLYVDVDVPGEGQPVRALDEHRLARHVAARALPRLKAQPGDLHRANAPQRLVRGRRLPADDAAARLRHRAVARHDLADGHIGPVQRVFLAQVRQPLPLQAEVLGALCAHVHLGKVVQHAAVVHVRMGDQRAAGQRVKAGQKVMELSALLLPVAGKAAVHKQILPLAADRADVAAAGRLEQVEQQPRRCAVHRDARAEGLAAVALHAVGEPADVFKRLVRAAAPAVQVLHDAVGADDQLVLGLLVQPQPLRDVARKGEVEHRVVQVALGLVVGQHAHGAQRRALVQELRQPRAVLLGQQPHAEALPTAAIALRVDVGDVEAVALDEPQHGQHAPRLVYKPELHQHDAAAAVLVLQITDARKAPRRLFHRAVLALHLDKQRAAVDGLVVADARDVDVQRRDALAGLQKRARVVVHVRDERLFHVPSLPQNRLRLIISRPRALCRRKCVKIAPFLGGQARRRQI